MYKRQPLHNLLGGPQRVVPEVERRHAQALDERLLQLRDPRVRDTVPPEVDLRDGGGGYICLHGLGCPR